MSIVGTRPPLISETNLYEPHHKVKTGLNTIRVGMKFNPHRLSVEKKQFNKKLKKSRFSAGSACRRPGYMVQLF